MIEVASVVFLLGAAGWAIFAKASAWQPTTTEPRSYNTNNFAEQYLETAITVAQRHGGRSKPFKIFKGDHPYATTETNASLNVEDDHYVLRTSSLPGADIQPVFDIFTGRLGKPDSILADVSRKQANGLHWVSLRAYWKVE